MSKPEEDLLRDLRMTFQTEAAEHLQTLNHLLLQLERATDPANRHTLLQEALGTAHTLKGAAQAVDFDDIARLVHAIESVMQALHGTEQPPDPKTCDMLYDALDAIEQFLKGQMISIDPIYNRLVAQGLEIHPPGAVSHPQDAAHIDEDVAAVMPSEETIRVSVNKLDNLMAQAGELLVSKLSAEQRQQDVQHIRRRLSQWPKIWRTIKTLLPHLSSDMGGQLTEVLTDLHEELTTLSEEVNSLDHALGNDTLRLGMVATGLQDEVRRVRMVPLYSLNLGLQRAVRDAAHDEGKDVTLQISGSDVELDKQVLETLKDPLLHLLRNAVSHGIESPAERTNAGKPEQGILRLTAQQRGSEIHLTVSDDGRGFDLERLRQAADKSSEVNIDSDTTDEDVIDLAFMPGISTASQLTGVSGRGIGLDVVRQRLHDLQGRIRVESQPDRGTIFHLVVPVSLSVTHALMVKVNEDAYALPLLSVEQIRKPRHPFTVEGRWMMELDGTRLPLVPLAGVLDLPVNGTNNDNLAVIIGAAEQRLALLVEDVLTQQELVAKPLGRPLKHVHNVAGAALLGNGEPVIVLNPGELIETAKGVTTPVMQREMRQTDIDTPTAHILVVDDSITTRTLEKNILQAAGYTVITATHGEEALERLKANPIDLIVSDVKMQPIDGIELTSQIREDPNYENLPVILVTSLESREDRERGMRAGADAYIIKRGFDQAELLATIEQFL